MGHAHYKNEAICCLISHLANVDVVRTCVQKIILTTVCGLLMTACGGISSIETTTTTSSTTTTSPTTTTSSTSTSTIPAILSIFSSTVPGLSVGDCFNEGSIAVQVDCSQLHDGQVIATNVSLDYGLSGTTSAELWIADAEDKCSAYYKNFVSHDYNREESRFNISILVSDGFSTNVSCTVVSADGKKWAGSAKNFIGSYVGISVGDCLMFPTDVNDAKVINCSQPHEGEMFVEEKLVGITLKTAPYPTRSEWLDIGDRICGKPFLAYTGVTEDDETLSYSFTYPLEEDWAVVSGRTVSCIATSYTGELLSYSVRR